MYRPGVAGTVPTGRHRPTLGCVEPDPSVDAYLDALAGPRRATLSAWRALCLDLPDGFVEGIRYGMPCYSRAGEPELAFAAQKRHLSLYVMRTDVMAAHRHRLAGYSTGRGCIRFLTTAPSDPDLVADLVRATGASSGTVC